MPEWFEEFFGGLYAEVMPRVFDDGATLEQVRVIKKLLRLRKGQRVLDIPCGMGRLTIPMAKTGCKLTGVDLMQPYIARAKRRAADEDLDIEFISGDMRRIDFDNVFDAAINWFGSFGYFSDAENLIFCKRVLKALKPGGSFLVETMNKSWLLSHFRSEGKHKIGDIEIEKRHRWDANTSRVEATWTFRKGRTIEKRTMKIKLLNGTGIRALLRAAGFRNIKIFPNPPTGRFTRHAVRMIAIGKRPLS